MSLQSADPWTIAQTRVREGVHRAGWPVADASLSGLSWPVSPAGHETVSLYSPYPFPHANFLHPSASALGWNSNLRRPMPVAPAAPDESIPPMITIFGPRSFRDRRVSL